VLSEKLAEDVFRHARVAAFKRLATIPAQVVNSIACSHPLKGFGGGYEFLVPLLEGDHVTEDAGTGFVHTAPGHGREDFDVWMENKGFLEAARIDMTIPYTVDENGAFTDHAPGFIGKRVITDEGEKGDLNDARVNARIADAFEREGADAWYQPGARERFLGELANEDWQKVDDILDVWFDSGSTHAFVLEDPAHFPSLSGIKRKRDGGPD